jgi:hypothetical protein
VLPGTALADRADSFGLKYQKSPPYHIESTPKFTTEDIGRAATIGRSCDIFYTQGRAVTWFLSALRPLKLKPAQFFQDFAQFLAEPVSGHIPEYPDQGEFSQLRAQALQLKFVEKKYREKRKAYLLPVLLDIIQLNGAWTRALAEGEETVLSLSYDPDDLMSGDAMDLEYFTENAYMETCTVRIFAGREGPELEMR